MTGQEFLRLQDEKIFRPAVMDAIIDEFEPPEDTFLMTDAFCPMKNVTEEEMVVLVKGGSFGRTNPVALGAEHMRVNLPAHYYRETRPGYWRESVVFDEEFLTRVKKPEKPDELWGEEAMGEALNHLDLRLDTMIEYLTAAVIQGTGYTVNRNGVAYTYNAQTPNKYRIYVGLAGGAPASYQTDPFVRYGHAVHAATDLWSALATSQPLSDLRNTIRYFSDSGFSTQEIWMGRTVAGYIEDNTTAGGLRDLIEANPAMAGKMITAESIVTAVVGLKGLTPVVDDRRYLEETGITRPIVAADTILNVQDTYGFAAGDIITMRDDATGVEEDAVIAGGGVSQANRTITITAVCVNAFTLGSRITATKPFMRQDQLIVRGKISQRAPRAHWVSTPSLIKAKSYSKPEPGRYTWTTFNDKVPYWVEVGAGIHGGPQVLAPGGWMNVRVA